MGAQSDEYLWAFRGRRLSVMAILLATAGIFALAMAGMAAGLLAGKALKGSCGGIGASDCFCDNADAAKPKNCPKKRSGAAGEKLVGISPFRR